MTSLLVVRWTRVGPKRDTSRFRWTEKSVEVSLSRPWPPVEPPSAARTGSWSARNRSLDREVQAGEVKLTAVSAFPVSAFKIKHASGDTFHNKSF